MERETLLIPVYLNQRIVFDLIAMLQGGISTVTTVIKQEATKEESADKVRASFGLSNALSALLKIGLSAEKEKISGEDTSQQVSDERVHTPASLFYLLRNILIKEEQIINDKESASIKPGDIIEFEASLNKNPIVETIESMADMMSMASMFTQPDKSTGKSKHRKEDDEYKTTRKQMLSFTDSLKAGETIDLTTEKLKSGHRAVLTLELQFLNDPMMSDLIDGQFKILGKVIRSIDNETESISLIRKTAISKMPEALLKDMFSRLSELSDTQGFSIPKLEWEVKGPVIQVIPISIFA